MVLAVRNYGHFWSRDEVWWGSKGKNNSGCLEGYVIFNRKPRVTDFREQIGIYVLFGENREVVYIGQTGSGDRALFLRLRDHTRDHLRDRWDHFSWFGFRSVNKDGKLSPAQKPNGRIQGNGSDALNEIEAVLLQLFEPRLNKRGPNWGKTEEFLQYHREDWIDVEEDFRNDVAERLGKIEAMLEKQSE